MYSMRCVSPRGAHILHQLNRQRAVGCLQIANSGGLEALLVDTAGRVISSSYGERVALHEAGHFLCAYLVGLLPRRYTLSSLDALKRYSLPTTLKCTLKCLQ